MLNKYRFLELIICIEIIIISSFIPVKIPLPSIKNFYTVISFPINWQIPTIIFLTLFYKEELVTKAYSVYIFIGLFFLPVFYDGGSLGYLLTPNFGYLLGIYPLIKIINNFNTKKNISLIDFIKYPLTGLFLFHFIGILYLSLQLFIFSKVDLILYNIGKYTINKLPYQIIIIISMLMITKIIKKLKNR